MPPQSLSHLFEDGLLVPEVQVGLGPLHAAVLLLTRQQREDGREACMQHTTGVPPPIHALDKRLAHLRVAHCL